MPLIAILFISLAMSEPREVLVPNHRAEKYSSEILESSSKISATKKYLKFDSAIICDVIINKKDLKEDFPDSVWDGFLIGPIRDRVKSELKRNPSKQFVFDFDSSLVFATIKPVIRAAATGGASSAIVVISQKKAIKIELFKEIKENHITHSADDNSMGVVLLMRRDSLIAFDNAPEVNPNRVLGLLSPNADTLTLSDAELLESFLTSIRKRTMTMLAPQSIQAAFVAAFILSHPCLSSNITLSYSSAFNEVRCEIVVTNSEALRDCYIAREKKTTESLPLNPKVVEYATWLALYAESADCGSFDGFGITISTHKKRESCQNCIECRGKRISEMAKNNWRKIYALYSAINCEFDSPRLKLGLQSIQDSLYANMFFSERIALKENPKPSVQDIEFLQAVENEIRKREAGTREWCSQSGQLKMIENQADSLMTIADF